MDPSAEYTKRLDERRRWLVESHRKSHLVATLRLAAGLVSLLFVYLVLALHQFSGWFILLPVGVYIGLVIYSMSVYPKEQRALRAVRFYELGLARIKGKWVGAGNPGTSFADTTNLYVNDLDIFGVGSVFELLCTARTQAGQETLARWLSAPAPSAEIRRRQEAVEELATTSIGVKTSRFSDAKCGQPFNLKSLQTGPHLRFRWNPPLRESWRRFLSLLQWAPLLTRGFMAVRHRCFSFQLLHTAASEPGIDLASKQSRLRLKRTPGNSQFCSPQWNGWNVKKSHRHCCRGFEASLDPHQGK